VVKSLDLRILLGDGSLEFSLLDVHLVCEILNLIVVLGDELFLLNYLSVDLFGNVIKVSHLLVLGFNRSLVALLDFLNLVHEGELLLDLLSGDLLQFVNLLLNLYKLLVRVLDVVLHAGLHSFDLLLFDGDLLLVLCLDLWQLPLVFLELFVELSDVGGGGLDCDLKGVLLIQDSLELLILSFEDRV